MPFTYIRPNPTHPYNNPASPQFRRNMVYAVGDVGVGNGMSWSYYNPRRIAGTHVGASGLGIEAPWSRPAVVISTATYETKFPNDDVKKWNPQLKSNLASLVDAGYLTVDIDGVGTGVTGDQIRTFV